MKPFSLLLSFWVLSRLIIMSVVILALATCNTRVNWVTLQNETYQLEFKYPENWTIEDEVPPHLIVVEH
jgi:hypothetical protein